MFKKAFAILLGLGILLFASSSFVEAKLLPRFRSTGKKTGSVSNSVVISPRLRSDRRAITLNLSNLNSAKNITYTLIYQANGKDEGVMGSIDPKAGNSASRELLFGTCSAGVCRYHANIKNARLEIVTQLNSGKKLLRRFKIKV